LSVTNVNSFAKGYSYILFRYVTGSCIAKFTKDAWIAHERGRFDN